MRWGRTNRKQEEENSSTEKQKKKKEKEKKNSSLSELLSFSWLSKFRPKNKAHNNSPPNSLAQNAKRSIEGTQRSPCHLSTDQAIAPRRRSVGDEDRPILNRHRRHHSVGGDHVCFVSSMTLGHSIPFSVVPKQNRNIPPVPPFYQKVPDPGLYVYPQKVRRRTKLKTRLVVTSSIDDTRRRSFNGMKTQLRRYNYRATAHSLRQGRPRRGLEKFAVVKKSSEPERDFKKSMLEMIVEKGIRRPKDLERLLACYLTLNADEHYDVIVKVFRQVCFEINRKQIGERL